jgi:uncharacterized membrane protein
VNKFAKDAIGHGIYLFVNEGFRLSKTVKSYLIVSFASLLLFAPWIFILVNQYSQANRLTKWALIYDKTNEELVKIWIHNLSLAFFDIGQSEYSDKFLLLYVFVVSLVGYSIFFLCRNTPRLFLFKNYPSESWKNELENQQNYKVELAFQGDVLWLWRLEKNR